jgi:hypothetical protein
MCRVVRCTRQSIHAVLLYQPPPETLLLLHHYPTKPSFSTLLYPPRKAMKSIALLALAVSTASAFAPQQSANTKTSTTEVGLTKAEILASPNTLELGKVYDPLGLSKLGGDETLSWFRHSEVKHGRIAMAAFVGWCVTGAGLRFPGELAPGLSFESIPSKGLEAWDAIPGLGKVQFLLLAGLIEFHDELFFSKRGTHYMKGGIPGKVRQDRKEPE